MSKWEECIDEETGQRVKKVKIRLKDRTQDEINADIDALFGNKDD